MIVQTAPPGEPHFVIRQVDHARTSGALARVFGNAACAPLAPRDLMEFVVTHHDEGWDAVDAAAHADPRTGLVYHLTQTPLPLLVQTSQRTPAFNARQHPFCGIISSMHSWGLYNGRYGLSDKIFIDMIGPDQRPLVDTMLQGELDRQAQLKAQLQADPRTAAWADPAVLLHNYKLLQFFDTLALYFQMTHESERGDTQFQYVPRAPGDDVTVTLRRIGPATVSLTPYPFAVERVEVTCAGRYLMPQPAGTDLAAVLRDLPLAHQQYTIVAG